MPADVAIVVVTYNSAEAIGALLDSLPAALDGLVADVVIVDNGSSDQTCALVGVRRDCRLLRSTNTGYADGINRGIALTAGSPVLVLNPDTRLGPDSVRRLLERLGRPSVGVAVPKVLEIDGRVSPSLRRDPTLARALGLGGTRLPLFSEYVHEASAYDHAHRVDWALGAAMLIRRECLDAVGPWDASFFLYSEETDFCHRARESGWEIWYEPTAEMTHVGGASGRSDKTHVMQIVNRVRFYARHHGRAAAWCYWALAVLSELSWLVRGHRQSRASVLALVRPSRRPAELEASGALVPR